MDEVWLYAVPQAGPDNTIIWSLGEKSNPTKGGRTKLDFAHNSGPRTIIVRLENPDKLDVRFNTGDPLWIYEGMDCPPPKGVDSKQIPEQHIECDASVLSFVDKNNGKARTLTYQLNFEDSKGRPVTPLDPQIKNGGGTGGFVSYLLPLAGGIALLGLGYLAYEAFFEQ